LADVKVKQRDIGFNVLIQYRVFKHQGSVHRTSSRIKVDQLV